MATVVHVPQGNYESPGQSTGEAIGGGLARIFGMEMRRREEQRQVEQVNAVLAAIHAAGSKEKALEIIARPGVLPFKDTKDINAALGWVKEIYPDKPQEEHDVLTGYSRTGDTVQKRVPRSEAQRIQNDPNAQENLFGPGMSLNKPGDLEELFKLQPDGTALSQGTNRVTNRMPGEYTAKELERIDKKQADERKERSEGRAIAAQDRATAAANRANEALDLKREVVTAAMLADSFNFKKSIGVDGMTLNLDLSGETPEKVRQWLKAREEIPTLMKQNKSPTEIASVLSRKYGLLNEDKPAPTPAPPAPAPKGGAVEKIKEKTGIGVPSEVKSRFDADPQMKGRKLGQKTDRGWEVIENGRLIGFWK